MPYKSMENLYSTYCDSLILKVTRIEREIERLKNLLIVNAERHKETDGCIINLWHGVTESEITKDNIYAIKRKESLLLSVLYGTDAEKSELVASQHEQEDKNHVCCNYAPTMNVKNESGLYANKNLNVCVVSKEFLRKNIL